jgi:hypothetical protein
MARFNQSSPLARIEQPLATGSTSLLNSRRLMPLPTLRQHDLRHLLRT